MAQNGISSHFVDGIGILEDEGFARGIVGEFGKETGMEIQGMQNFVHEGGHLRLKISIIIADVGLVEHGIPGQGSIAGLLFKLNLRGEFLPRTQKVA